MSATAEKGSKAWIRGDPLSPIRCHRSIKTRKWRGRACSSLDAVVTAAHFVPVADKLRESKGANQRLLFGAGRQEGAQITPSEAHDRSSNCEDGLRCEMFNWAYVEIFLYQIHEMIL